MQSFFSKLSRTTRARGPIQAPPAKGQAEVNALLNPDTFGSDDLDDFVQIIHAADPQARRGRGILALSPPASLLIEQAASDESVGDDLDTSPEEGSIHSSSASSPGSKGSFYLPYWDAIQDLEAAYADPAAEYDPDTSTTSGVGSTMFASMFASAMYDGDAPEIDLGGLTASSPPSRHRSVQGSPGLPRAGSNVSKDPGPSVGQTGHAPTMFSTSVVSFSAAPPGSKR